MFMCQNVLKVRTAPIPNLVNVKELRISSLLPQTSSSLFFFCKGNGCQLLQSPASVALAGGKQTDQWSKVSPTDAAPRAGPKRSDAETEKGVFSEGAELRHTASVALTLELMDGLPEDDTKGHLCILGDQQVPPTPEALRLTIKGESWASIY